MAFIEINKTCLVNVDVIDSQHVSFAAIVNNLYNDIITKRKKVNITLVIKLKKELELHFSTEERLMKENSFSGYFSHKLEHDRFLNKILNSLDAVINKGAKITIDDFETIKRWFFNHIEINDKKLGLFLNSKGIK